MSRYKFFSFRLSPNETKELEEIAVVSKRSKSDVLRLLISNAHEKYAGQHEKELVQEVHDD